MLVVLGLPSASLATGAPNPNDPCASAGRDSCGTTGVGFYGQSPFGIRWFGDYRGAVAGELQTFCIDLGYWYPGAKYKYRETSAVALHTRSGRLVPLASSQRMAYAIWTYGRTNDPKRQAAVMLYVHSQMGDARPGEVDPAKIDKTLVPVVAQIGANAARYHGPYRVDVRIEGNLVPGKASTATVRVLAASGAAVPNLPLSVTASGAKASGRRHDEQRGASPP